MSKTKVSNQDGYDLWSSFYDTYPNPTLAADEMSFPAYWAHHRGRKILEIGCGTGRHTGKLVRQGNFVTALDLSEGMLAVARGKIPDPKVRFLQGDFLGMEGLDEDHDVLLESLVLEHLNDPGAFFRKAFRHLKAGGDLYLSEIHPRRSAAGILAHFKAPGSDNDIHLVSHVHSEKDILSAAKAAGFHLERCVDVMGSPELTKQNEKWRKHEGLPLIQIWHFRKI